MSFKTISMGVALTCGTLAVGSSLGVSPAQAAFVNFTGTANFTNGNSNTPSSDKITFTNSKVESAGGSLFAGLVNTGVTVAAVELTNRTNVVNGGSYYSANYKGKTTNPFVEFLSNPSLKFIIDEDFTVTRIRTPANSTLGTLASTAAFFNFKGAFFNGNTYLSSGILTANKIQGTPGSYSLTIATVPEPLTILGSITALGMGVALKKKQVQNLAKKKVTA
ncbi:PEP-CTERM sorting domain-containing protein [Tolypothrix sp. FACHB-123]|uniref:PEP-CTERM sorting domain-containing protein n=1 Tax=Tolypothrix sp. FACHB-123 TaxID=2692868 RepID=UPI001688E451|nr:PEP-CTERM sorting domain-containing protein [Tolypothrix sp. FACHB-123]MBD2356821.1 PEP-CTERM sorting domain-containing protein [Tolypothrix sp. FACHB-123]